MIARMWESRIRPERFDDFCAWVRDVAWPEYATATGFAGGELYRSDEQQRAVVVTRWSDVDALAAGSEWFDLGAESFCEGRPRAWEFTPVLVD